MFVSAAQSGTYGLREPLGDLQAIVSQLAAAARPDLSPKTAGQIRRECDHTLINFRRSQNRRCEPHSGRVVEVLENFTLRQYK